MAPPSGTIALNNYLQANGALSSLSWVDTTEGPPHAPTWKCYCKISGQVISTGTGSHKHIARDVAAEQALRILA